ncbi:poly [ADP-ribose] polymerase 1-like [Microplitis demolitor]|uniref:poly [ADP-ribose] polymerase 1-like n=1 Tax=Microplitis demolitor TaxID=69319 RepID=UPI0004CD24A3|nr:poly [ADP-ribose] polymerase 1-like [Microplitis demolitor]XP_053594433.1 poly [ADP-ribose] polymerase 1-like [Microplitis demolitor]XP_053594434.1 poly [ADP-ribose] polymerase 1-like [Microplitis demolitor]
MDEPQQERLNHSKKKQLIENCSALKMDPALESKAYVYETVDRTYSMTWTKEESHNGEKMYYYYRVRILGLYENDCDEDKNYILEQNWGAFDTVNHRKRSESLPLSICINKFIIQTTERSRNYVFAKIKDNDINNNDLPISIRELIIRYIFNIDFLERMMEEYTFDVKNKIIEFINITGEFKTIRSKLIDFGVMRQRSLDNITKHEAQYDIIREFLNKKITCQSNGNDNNNRTVSLMNFYYKQLHTTIEVLDINDERYKIIEKYFKNTKSPKHKYLQFEIDNVFAIERPCDNDRYTRNLGNKKLLWHGTPASNIPSILYEGFRITKARFGMFGNGIYFSNTVSKSVNYFGSKKHGVLFLCEVALGNMMEQFRLQSFTNINTESAHGFNSVYGRGKWSPDPNYSFTIHGDVVVPCGQLINVGCGYLEHDEFTVYNPAQIKMRYLVSVNFN